VVGWFWGWGGGGGGVEGGGGGGGGILKMKSYKDAEKSKNKLDERRALKRNSKN